jgi:DNA polymerase III subunit beta
MKIKFEPGSILGPLTLAASAAPAKAKIPVLSHILMRAAGEALSITGFDMTTQVTSRTDDVIIEEEGEACIPAQRLLSLVRGLPREAEATLSVDDGVATLRCRRSRYAMDTLPVLDFPSADDMAGEETSATVSPAFLDALRLAAGWSAKDDVRYFLVGVYLEGTDSGAKLTATDGHRLISLDTAAALPSGVSVIIPRAACAALGRLSSEAMTLSVGPRSVRLSTIDTSITCRLIDGQYPDWRRILPDSVASSVTLSRVEAIEATKRLASGDEAPGVQMRRTDEGLRMERGAGVEVVEVAASDDGGGGDGEFATAINAQYLLAALTTRDDESVTLALDSAGKLVVQDDAMVSIVMPVRL